jgi:predicted nuclease of predicted toxin-antitoxin system
LKFLCDADVDRPLVDRLREDGYNTLYMAEIKKDASDEEVLATANSNGAILITRDKGFGELVFRQGLAFHGVLLIRLAGVPMEERKVLLAEAVRNHAHEFAAAFSVLTHSGRKTCISWPRSGAPSWRWPGTGAGCPRSSSMTAPSRVAAA